MFVSTPIYSIDDGTVVFGLRQPGVLPGNGDVSVRVSQPTENRLDLLSFRLFGDPSAWWAIADCSGLIDPLAGTIDGVLLRAPSTSRLPS